MEPSRLESIESARNKKQAKNREEERSRAKKLTVCGRKSYTDNETGEVEIFNVIRVEDTDANFQKLWLGHVLDAIDELGTAKIKVLSYLLEKRHPITNILIKTVREIAKELKISMGTVSVTLSTLEKHEIIKRRTGSIFVNPDVIFKGAHKNRLNVLIEYRRFDEDAYDGDKEEEEIQTPPK